MEHTKPPVVAWWQALRRRLGWEPQVSVDVLRRTCIDLIDDIPPGQKHELLQAIGRLHSVQDLRGLKPRLYDAVSILHGEREARERLAFLEQQLH
jgi:hypothetical protein